MGCFFFLFLFSNLLLGTVELKSLLLALQNGPEGIKKKQAATICHFTAGQEIAAGCERLRNKKIGHPQKYKQDRQCMAGMCPPMHSLVTHSSISLWCPSFFIRSSPCLSPWFFLFLGWTAGLRDVRKIFSFQCFYFRIIYFVKMVISTRVAEMFFRQLFFMVELWQRQLKVTFLPCFFLLVEMHQHSITAGFFSTTWSDFLHLHFDPT